MGVVREKMNNPNLVIMNTVEVTTKVQIFYYELDKNNPLIKTTLEAVYEEKANNKPSIESNVKASYVSSWFSHIENKKFLPIVNFVKQLAESNLENSSLEFECSNCWGAIYEKNDYTIEHFHFPNTFSAVVYLDMSSESANIFFGEHEIKVKKGTVLLFPSFVSHHVPKTNDKRVVVAMNFITVSKLNSLVCNQGDYN